ncbi:hypothetical protein ZYGR_0S00220 [Zygosaccharomyces rouxii]|uniref:ZYRO0F02970p n=2 Tax=Zygosaccharomyces rouxii TaxID=4956 RepID=C5DX83_ZYGRC|nr:uncharacterized protein ZYRO0F02970g [Zygosaccharomyces rouxii]KAH9199158.1 hypothetical protein LQ764DRAFT_235020 [Zygosaccharomyces rouxii]GAV49890.1 hypothetical protein ZYGR_0S00220 [Zygosaccharomyces rouxii]CAR28394.1 ZYRO0F02970p [Zygosaccharomyces rouxii]
MTSSGEDLGSNLQGLSISEAMETKCEDGGGMNYDHSSRRDSLDLGAVSFKAFENDEFAEIHYRDAEDGRGAAALESANLPQITSNNGNIENDSDSDSDSGWQIMPTIASYNIYDEKGQLSIRPYEVRSLQTPSQEELSSKDKSNTKTTFGYTKVAAEEQAQRSFQTNRKTDFLFDHRRLRNDSSRGTLASDEKAKDAMETDHDSDSSEFSQDEKDDEETFYDEYEDDVEPMDDLNPDTQLDATKNMLTEKEKFAYVGAINVLINQICTELATLCLCVDNITSHRKLARRLQFAQKDTAAWKTDILERIYTHLNVSDEEIIMIEQLSNHGVRLEDLCKCLKTHQKVENPFEEHDDSKNDENNEEEKIEKEQKSPNEKESDIRESCESTTSSVTKRNLEDEAEDNKESYGINMPNEVVNPDMIKDKSRIDIDVAWTVICDLFLLLLQDAAYDARSRILLLRFAEVLNVTGLEVAEFERRITDSLDMEQSTEDQNWDETKLMKDRRKRRRRKKLCYVGLAMVGGSLVLGLSGGLLAPVIGAGIAAGLSTVGITGATGFLTGAGGATAVAVTSTAIGGNIGFKGMKRRMGSVRTFEFCPLHNNRRVNLLISVSGWMIGNVDDVRLPYSTVDPVEGDLYSLNWEPEMLKSIGESITIIANELFATTIQQVLGATVLTAFISAIQWPMWLSKLSYILDNPWNVSLDRAWSAGKILADTLIAKNLGQRPTTLMGFSLGSRVIFSCLVELCKKKAFGLVENVYLFGTPVIKNKEQLVMARSVVSGRFVNAYSEKDWMLAYLFRAAAGGFSTVMGITPITNVEGIENFDCTDVVDGHLAYRKNMPKLLKRLGISVVSEQFVEIEEDVDFGEIKRKRKLVEDVDAAQKKLSEKKKHNSWVPKWLKPKKSKWRSMVEDTVEEGKEIEIPAQAAKEEDMISDSTRESMKEPSTKAGAEEGTTEKNEEDDEAENPSKKDPVLIDHGALMNELKLIKQAIHEEQRHKKKEMKEDEEEEDKDESEGNTADETPNASISEKNKSSRQSSYGAPQSPGNFQLLGAGRTILPEDDDMFKQRNKSGMTFEFPDDI